MLCEIVSYLNPFNSLQFFVFLHLFRPPLLIKIYIKILKNGGGNKDPPPPDSIFSRTLLHWLVG
jgi:hypothetical protein